VFLGARLALREKLDVEGTRLEEEADGDSEAGRMASWRRGGAGDQAGRYNAAHLAARGAAYIWELFGVHEISRPRDNNPSTCHWTFQSLLAPRSAEE
jgi:hypothetical protein